MNVPTHDRDVAAQAAGCAAQVGGESAQGGTAWVLAVNAGASYSFSTPPIYPAGVRPAHPRLRFYSSPPTCSGGGTPLGGWESGGGVVPAGAVVAVVTTTSSVALSPWCHPPYPHYCPYVGVLPTRFTYAESDDVPPPPPDPAVHVDDVTLTADHRGKRTHLVTATATVVDEWGRPVAGVTVGLRLTSPEGTAYTGTGTTDAWGRASYTAEQSSGGHGTWTGCVVEVTADVPHDSGADRETCDGVAVS